MESENLFCYPIPGIAAYRNGYVDHLFLIFTFQKQHGKKSDPVSVLFSFRRKGKPSRNRLRCAVTQLNKRIKFLDFGFSVFSVTIPPAFFVYRLSSFISGRPATSHIIGRKNKRMNNKTIVTPRHKNQMELQVTMVQSRQSLGKLRADSVYINI